MDIRELIPLAQRNHPVIQGMWSALIHAPVPAVETDHMYVTIPDIDPSIVWGPCFWMPRSKKALVAGNNVMIPDPPAAGRPALVLFDNRQELWVVSWW